MPRKFHGCHTRRKLDNMNWVRWLDRRMRVYVRCVRGRLKETWTPEFAWASGILYHQEYFNLIRRKIKVVPWRFVCRPPCAVQLSSNISYSILRISTFCVIKSKKKKKRENRIMFLCISIVVFLCYTTLLHDLFGAVSWVCRIHWLHVCIVWN